jgi:hypothetical protein
MRRLSSKFIKASNPQEEELLQPDIICICGHARADHNFGLKSAPCEVNGCDCLGYEPAFFT